MVLLYMAKNILLAAIESFIFLYFVFIFPWTSNLFMRGMMLEDFFFLFGGGGGGVRKYFTKIFWK